MRTVITALAGAQPAGINNHGTIVGAISPNPPQPPVPFRWTERRGLEFFLGNVAGQATAINDAGAIVGVIYDGDEAFTGFLWIPHQGIVNLGAQFLPLAINNRLQIVGTVTDQYVATGPYLWEKGGLTPLSGETVGIASDINDRGQVVGQVGSSAFLWSANTGLIRLPRVEPPTGSNPSSTAYSINNSGEAVGAEGQESDVFPVRWTRHGVPSGLSVPNGIFTAVNDRGVAVGRYEFAFEPTRYDWMTFVATSHGDVIPLGRGVPVAINNAGTVVAMVLIHDRYQVVVWSVSP